MLTDSHCHLGSHKFESNELDDLVQRAIDAGVHRLVTISTNLEDIPRNLAIADCFPGISACVGIHPCDVHESPDDYLPALRDFAQHPKVAAIGETGLDYFHPAPDGWTDTDYHERQRAFLRSHFELSAELGLNIVIHTRDRNGDQSFADALAIYEPFSKDVQAVFHCFPGPYSQAERVLSLGGLVSFTGIATFKKAAEVLDAAVQCPLDRLMVETDSPYLAPTPHRGKRCEPAFVRLTAEAIAQARSVNFTEFAEQTESTVDRFFRFQI
jgi:TatD DNase family protein